MWAAAQTGPKNTQIALHTVRRGEREELGPGIRLILSSTLKFLPTKTWTCPSLSPFWLLSNVVLALPQELQ